MKFNPGEIVATPGALELLERHGKQPITYVSKHISGIWGDLCAEDKKANDAALTNGARILSAYSIGTEKLWIITDAEDDYGVRASTCLLLPDEY